MVGQDRAPRRFFLLLAMLAVWLSALAQVVAASATPTPIIPDPAQCTVEPRRSADFEMVMTLTPVPMVNIHGTPAPTPAPPTGGVPADAALQEEIGQTVITVFACTYATDLERFAALMSDDFFRFLFAGSSAESLAAMEDAPPIPEDQRAPIGVISDVQVLPDGRVSAQADGNGSTGLMIFEHVENRWLLDYFYNFSSDGTPTP